MLETRKIPPSNDSGPILPFVRELTESIKSGSVAVFCGAGISFPSGLPTVDEFTPYMLDRLGLTDREKKIFQNSKLPFEAFIEVIAGGSDPNKIFDIFALGKPNAGHVLLAKLAKAGLVNTICTTNFDCLIEDAFHKKELERDVHYRVYDKETEFAGIDWGEKTVRLVKIHGSIEDRENMAVTISRVASKSLSAQRMGVIEHLFRDGTHNIVLVLGYSCSDVFDISPQIESIRGATKRVILIDHQPDVASVECLSRKPGGNPFRRFRDSLWIRYDTDKLVQIISGVVFPGPGTIQIPPPAGQDAWRRCVDEWYRQTGEDDNRGCRQNIVGILFSKISEYGIAGKYFGQALTEVERAGEERKRGCCLGNLAGIHAKLGEYDKAEELFRWALDIAEECGDKRRMEEWLGNLGGIHGDLGDYAEAESCYRRALILAKEIGNRNGEERHLGNLGNILKDTGRNREAIDCYNEALRIAEDIGDKSGEGRHRGNLGNAYRSIGDYRRAGRCYRRALAIAEAIGDRRERELREGNLGNLHQVLGEYKRAIHHHREALLLAREIGDKKREGLHLANLGVVGYDLGRFQRARVLFRRALAIAEEVGDKRGREWRLGYLGLVHSALGDDRKAVSLHKQALSLARAIGDKRGEASWLGHLGSAYNNLGDYHKAIEYYQPALGIAEKSNDKWGEANWRANLGGAHFNLGDFPAAIEYFEQALGIFRSRLDSDHPYVKRIEESLAEARSADQQKGGPAMYDVKADAARKDGVIDVTVTGSLPNSSYQATVVDKYPGGNIVYVMDPGSARVFVETSVKPGSEIFLMRLVPWVGHVKIPNQGYKQVNIFINGEPAVEAEVRGEPER